MGTTARLALPYPAAATPNDVPTHMQALADQLAATFAGWLPDSTAALRPAASAANARSLHRATDTGEVSLSTGATWVTILTGARSVSFFTTHTWAIAFPAVESGDTDLIIPMSIEPSSGETIALARVSHKINSGTSVTFDVTVNGSGATGFTSLSSTTSNTRTDPSNVALAAGDKVKPDISAVSGTPKNWEATVVLLHTVSVV